MTKRSVGRNIIALILILGFGAAAFNVTKVHAASETIHWECPADGSWNDQANWTIDGNPAGRIPNNSDIIIIDCSTDSMINTSANIDFSSLTLGGGNGNVSFVLNNDISSGTDLTINNNGNAYFWSLNNTLTSLTVNSGGKFSVQGTGDLAIDTINVKSGGTLTSNFSTKLSVISTNLTIENGGQINVDAKTNIGTGTGVPTGTCSDNVGGAGGGYGGNGGNGQTSGNCPSGISGGLTYGSETQPIDFGSAGGPGGGNLGTAYSNVGGGAIKIVTQNLDISGTITANGGDGANQSGAGAGGSGGSIWIDTEHIAGTGTITANGGIGGASQLIPQEYGGAGGGGRIAIYYHNSSLPGLNISASAGGTGAGDGTIYMNPQPAPIITSIDPASGSQSGGKQATIHGHYFLNGQNLNVKFDGNDVTGLTFNSTTSITVTTPPNTNTGAVDVKVHNNDGKEATLTNGYTYTTRDPVSMTTTLNQQISRGDFGFDITPSAAIDFGSVKIDDPNKTYSLYYNGDPDNVLKIHDGRYSGGLRVTVQSTSFDPSTPNDPSDDIPSSALSVLTSNNSIDEITKDGTPRASTPAGGTPGNDPDYVDMTNPVVILDTAGNSPTCDIGRVGTYQTHVSYRLNVPTSATSGHYHATITYDITEAPLGC